MKLKINVVFNYSYIELTPDLEMIFNKGLKFAILPLKLDITQVLKQTSDNFNALWWGESFGLEKNLKYHMSH